MVGKFNNTVVLKKGQLTSSKGAPPPGLVNNAANVVVRSLVS